MVVGTAFALASGPTSAAAAMMRVESRMVHSPRGNSEKRRDRKEAPCPKHGALGKIAVKTSTQNLM
jgi:hypothetical protein